jgi:uncharacterized membrane protein
MSDDIREQARKRIKARRDYWQMLAIFGGVTLLLVIIWALTSPGEYFWPIWPVFGFAIAALFGAISTFGPFNRPITDEHVDEEIRRMNGGNPPAA